MILVALLTVLGTLPLSTANCAVENPDNAIHNGTCMETCPVNTTLFYFCIQGYLLREAVVTCMDNNMWYPPIGTCVIPEPMPSSDGTCPDPTPENGTAEIFPAPVPENGTNPPEGRYAVNSLAILACNEGYQSFPSEFGFDSICEQPGIWVPSLVECIRNNEAHCPNPMAPTNGAVFELTPPCANGTCDINTLAIFSCDLEYLLVGYGTITCIGHGEWNLPFPTCEATCADPTPTNGQVNTAGLANGRYRINSVVSFTCDANYFIKGDNMESTCRASGTWDPQPPICTVPKSCSPGFTNYWKFGCYKVDWGNKWFNAEARCQTYGPNVHLAGMETLQEMRAVHKAVKNIGTSWFWLGGKYNSTSGKYYWVGSGVDADISAMFQYYPPRGRSDYNLVLRRPWNNINAYWNIIYFRSLCEEY